MQISWDIHLLTCANSKLCVLVQDMIQKMFGFLPNSEPTTVSEERDPIYDTPPRAPRPIVIAEELQPQTSSQSLTSQSQTTVSAAPAAQSAVTTRPTPVARVRSARNTYVDVLFIFTFTASLCCSNLGRTCGL